MTDEQALNIYGKIFDVTYGKNQAKDIADEIRRVVQAPTEDEAEKVIKSWGGWGSYQEMTLKEAVKRIRDMAGGCNA